MTNSEVLNIMHRAIIVAAELSMPLLLLSMAVGIFISILQAATQIHEQTITFVPKLALIAIICLASGGWMLETMQSFFYQIFDLMLK